jgi:DNA-binding CsgD family transcriptional regulator
LDGSEINGGRWRSVRGVISGPALENLVASVAETCRLGLEPDELRRRVLPRLRRAVPVDALWWASVDPATLLFTGPYREEIPADTGPYFVENEFLRDDANKWTELARDPGGVRTLLEATGGELEKSARYRDIFQPLGLADELRAVLRSAGVTWGFMCLHREGPDGFSRAETQFVQRIAPHLAEGIRLGLLIGSLPVDQAADGPGLLLLAEDGSLAGANPSGEQWLEELAEPTAGGALPLELLAVVARLRASRADLLSQPRLCVRTCTGRWAVLHASWLGVERQTTVAVIIEQAAPLEVAPVVMAAYGLTERERAVAGLVCQGLSTTEIAARLHVSANTVQDHLKPIFHKTGVRSRRELVASILRHDYLPQIARGQKVGANGFFASDS